MTLSVFFTITCVVSLLCTAIMVFTILRATARHPSEREYRADD